MDIESLLMGAPTTNAEQILKLIAQYKALDMAGNAVVHHFTKDDELERLQREDLKLKIAGERKALGFQYEDDQEYEDADNSRTKSVLGGIVARHHRANPVTPSNSIMKAVFKEGTYAPISDLPNQGLEAIFKTAYHEPLTKEAKYGSSILRSILKR